mgnify:CR=1 FL=1
MIYTKHISWGVISCMRSNYISIEEKFRYFLDCVATSSEIESFFFLDLPEIIL